MLPLDLAAGRQPDREDDRPDPGHRVRQDQHERRPVLAQQADEPQHRRRRGGIHEREEPARLGVGIDIQPLAKRHAHLVPEAVILVRHARAGRSPAGSPRRRPSGAGTRPSARARAASNGTRPPRALSWHPPARPPTLHPRSFRRRGESSPAAPPHPCHAPWPAGRADRVSSSSASPSLARPVSRSARILTQCARFRERQVGRDSGSLARGQRRWSNPSTRSRGRTIPGQAGLVGSSGNADST